MESIGYGLVKKNSSCFRKTFTALAATAGSPKVSIGVGPLGGVNIVSAARASSLSGAGRQGSAAQAAGAGAGSPANPQAARVSRMCGGVGASTTIGGWFLDRGTSTRRASNCRAKSARAP